MASHSVGYTVHHSLYPGGSGTLLAWDYTATRSSEITTYLLRSAQGYFVHYRVADTEAGDSVLSLDAADAAYLYRRLRVRFTSTGGAFD